MNLAISPAVSYNNIMDPIPELLTLLNKALTMEHSAAIQYLTHAQLVSGPGSAPIIAQLRDSGLDEQKHSETLRELIGDFLLATPTVEMAPVKSAGGLTDILEINLASEREAVSVYEDILARLAELKADPAVIPIYYKLEREIRLIAIEEIEHASELIRLLR